MRIARFGVFAILLLTVGLASSCSYYNRVMARKNLVDGAKAYKDRKFPEAETLFRYAASLDPAGNTVEGRTAQLSLARTIHSEYIGDRGNKALAESALNEYKKSLPQSLKDLTGATADYDKNPNAEENQKRYLGALSAVNSTSGAVASLFEALGQPDEAKKWQESVASGAEYPATARARAYSSLTAKQNTCANDISDTDATKKTVTGKDGKPVYQFVKPASAEDFAKLKACVAEGSKVIEQAVALEPQSVKDAGSLNISTLSDVQIALNLEIFKVFESVRSYKASLINQSARIAEMDGNTAERDRLKTAYEAAKADFQKLSDVVKKMGAEVDARVAAKEAAEKADANNANSNANKK